MLFSSISFIFVFLPILFVLCICTKKEYHNIILLIASIIFYAWGEPKFLLVMLSTILISYVGAILIEKYPKHRKLFLIFSVCSTLGFLVYFKYLNFIIGNINNIFHSHFDALNIILPLGISFYTFQALSYIIDVYKKESVAQKNILKLALFITFFPQLIAGPILKYQDIYKQIDSREITINKIIIGSKRFVIGLAKKMLLANILGGAVDKIFMQSPTEITTFLAWFGALAFTMQLYFDFGGYSDMAIGLGQIFGFKIKENFNYPWSSRTFSEGWRQWHISLTTWFKKYVYCNIPVHGNRYKSMLKLLFVFVLTGIWHGAAWNFIIWGFLNGLVIVIEKLVKLKNFEQSHSQWWAKVILHIYFIFTLGICLAIFRAENMGYAWKYIQNMLGLLNINYNNLPYSTSYYVGSIEVIAFIVGVICCTPIFKNMIYLRNKYVKVFVNIWLIILFVISVSAIASGTYNPFIYFRF